MNLDQIKNYFEFHKDFPAKGVNFTDVGSILKNGIVYKEFIDLFTDKITEKFEFDKIVALESRGFLFGCPIAYKLQKSIVMVRKKGKLPGRVISIDSSKEYGKDILEIQEDSISKGEKILILDDILATGGTARASIDLVEKLGGIVIGLAFVGEIKGLPNYELFKGYQTYSVFEF